MGGSKGIAFVRFVKAEDAQYCIQKLHRTKPDGFEQEVVVKLAHFDIGDCRNRANGNFKSMEVMNKAKAMQIEPNNSNVNNLQLNNNNNSPIINAVNVNNNSPITHMAMTPPNMAPASMPNNLNLGMNMNMNMNLGLLNLNVMNVPNMNVPLQYGVQMPALTAIPLVGQLPQYPLQGQMGYVIPPPQS